MNPLSILLILIGYAISIPIQIKNPNTSTYKRLANSALILGIGLSAMGWIIRQNYLISSVQIFWLILVRVRYWYSSRK